MIKIQIEALGKIFISAIITLLMLTSCEEIVTNVKNLPKIEPKLVISSFISPQDTFIKVTVSSSTPILGDHANENIDTTELNHALVTIQDENNSIIDTLKYNYLNQCYRADTMKLKITSGHQYHLKVATLSGHEAEANCTIPKQNNSLAFNSLDSTYDIYGNFEYVIRYNFQDDPATNDYYQPSAYIKEQGPFADVGYAEFSFNYGKSYFTDNLKQGGKFTLTEQIQPYYIVFPITVKLVLYDIDENYYQYISSLDNYYNAEDNLFAEPVAVYSNISGGLGIFAGYNSSSIEVQL